jgi:hypothetical protein
MATGRVYPEADDLGLVIETVRRHARGSLQMVRVGML